MAWCLQSCVGPLKTVGWTYFFFHGGLEPASPECLDPHSIIWPLDIFSGTVNLCSTFLIIVYRKNALNLPPQMVVIFILVVEFIQFVLTFCF